ncbi:MAG: polyphosphate kinase 1 [Erysipelotrichaceae bacterium]
MKDKIQPYLQNRELSWLRFNQRVLQEANDERLPLFERVKFLGIFESNLNEFYMIRVGGLVDLSKLKNEVYDSRLKQKVNDQLQLICDETRALLLEKDLVANKVQHALALHGFAITSIKMCKEKELAFLEGVLKKDILPLLSPQIIDRHHPFPHLRPQQLYLGVWLKKDGNQTFGLIPIPPHLPRVIRLHADQKRFVTMEDLIQFYAHKIFQQFEIQERVIFTLTRNADLQLDDEQREVDEDLVEVMQKLLKKRDRMAAVKLEMSHQPSEGFLTYLSDHFKLKRYQIFYVQSNMLCAPLYSGVLQTASQQDRILYQYPYHRPSERQLNKVHGTLIQHIQKKDMLLHYPYESFEVFLRFLEEVLADPTTQSIKITLYRVSSNPRLVDLLCRAAQKNIEVHVLLELRARFDEENNITHAETLKQAGCVVLYGHPNYKVHAKVCLITRKIAGKPHFISQFGTGNYHEDTVKLYCDYSLLTASQEIGQDVALFFQNMAMGNVLGNYQLLRCSPFSMKEHFMQLIDQEIEFAQQGKPAEVWIKANALTEIELAEKLIEASQQNVKVHLILRGICTLLPGIAGVSEHIEVRNVVGRFLEHARVYVFGSEERAHVFISSGDPMTRNLMKRVEVAVPILQDDVKSQILADLKLQWRDNTKARRLNTMGQWESMVAMSEPVDVQATTLRAFAQLPQHKQATHRVSSLLVKWLRHLANQIEEKMV